MIFRANFEFSLKNANYQFKIKKSVNMDLNCPKFAGTATF